VRRLDGSPPKEVSPQAIEQNGGMDARHSCTERLKTKISALPGAGVLKKMLYAVVPWEPFPEYRNPSGREWQLTAAIVRRFKELAADRPVVVVPRFMIVTFAFGWPAITWTAFVRSRAKASS
jgi:hypothetical protein